MDSESRILAVTTSDGQHKLGETGDPVELETLDAIKKNPLGIIFGSQRHTYEVSGFYRLQEAPWILVMIAPGSEVLAPINTFCTYLSAFRTVVYPVHRSAYSVCYGQNVAAIKNVSRAAEKLAGSDFMTLFVMVLDCNTLEIRWVLAGHDAPLIYNPLSDSFRELTGSGMALGVDDAWNYQEYHETACVREEIILIGTDGVWETENPQEERFGKERLRQVIRRNHQSAAGEIIEAILFAVNDFRQESIQEDDITLVVIKG